MNTLVVYDVKKPIMYILMWYELFVAMLIARINLLVIMIVASVDNSKCPNENSWGHDGTWADNNFILQPLSIYY